MKRLSLGLALLLCSVSLYAQKTRFGQELPNAKPGVDYPLTIHVYGLHVQSDCSTGYCSDVLEADVTSNGRKLELQCASGLSEKSYHRPEALSFGDFRARLLKPASGTELGDGYEILLPQNKVLGCTLSGMYE